MKKVISLCLAISIVMCMCVTAFASTNTGVGGFVGAMTDSTSGITGENLWTSLIPFAGLFVSIFIFAFAYGRLKKSTKSGSKGKFNW